MQNEYKTVKQSASAELEEKRSRFVAVCACVSDEDRALRFIDSVKRSHRDASHNVWAFNLRAAGLCRCTDDGEPQGTAGLPVLDLLRRRELLDTAVVVTRYFGGTLLGTGGLMRAYSGAAAMCLDEAGVAVMTECSELSLACRYGDYDRISRLAEDAGAEALSTDFGADVKLCLRVRADGAEALCAAIRELTRGECEARELRRGYFPI